MPSFQRAILAFKLLKWIRSIYFLHIRKTTWLNAKFILQRVRWWEMNLHREFFIKNNPCEYEKFDVEVV